MHEVRVCARHEVFVLCSWHPEGPVCTSVVGMCSLAYIKVIACMSIILWI